MVAAKIENVAFHIKSHLAQKSLCRKLVKRRDGPSNIIINIRNKLKITGRTISALHIINEWLKVNLVNYYDYII